MPTGSGKSWSLRTNTLSLAICIAIVMAQTGCSQRSDNRTAQSSNASGFPPAISDALHKESEIYPAVHPSGWSKDSYLISLEGMSWDTSSHMIESPLEDLAENIPNLARVHESAVVKLKLNEWLRGPGQGWRRGQRIGFVAPIYRWELIGRDKKDPSKFSLIAKSSSFNTLESNWILDCDITTCVESQDPEYSVLDFDFVGVWYLFSGVDSSQADALTSLYLQQLSVYQTATVLEVSGSEDGLFVRVDAKSISDVRVVPSQL